MSPTRYQWVDALRGLAAFSVLLWHYQHFFMPTAGEPPHFASRGEQPLYAIFQLFYEHGGSHADGGIAVETFWAISGFVFSHIYSHQKPGLRQFLIARFARLYPLHFATLILVTALQALSVWLTGHFQIYPANDSYHFMLHLGFASGWGLAHGWSFNAPIWSVSLEILVYLLFWLLLPILRSYGVWAGLSLALIFKLGILGGLDHAFWSAGLYFFSGVFMHQSLQAPPKGVPQKILWGLLIVGLCLWPHPERTLLYLLPLTLLRLAIWLDQKNPRPGHSMPIGMMADTTYGTYLLHVPLQITLILIMEAWGIQRYETVSMPAFLIGYLCLLYGLSFLSHRWFEHPLQRGILRRFALPS